MANRSLFSSTSGTLVPKASAINEAGGTAYEFKPQQALFQYVITGCLNRTFYATAQVELKTVLELCEKCEPEFIARLAVYARQRGFMKDSPALLCAVLAVRSPTLLAAIFDRVIDDGKMLRNFVQMVRSGVVGRKSFGTAIKRLIQGWFNQRSPEKIFRSSVGDAPSLGDVIKMVHPRPDSAERAALYGYLIGRETKREHLPQLVRHFEDFKEGKTSEVPDLPFQMLAGLPLSRELWSAIAKSASWHTLRMNLRTFKRHGVLDDQALVESIAARLRDPDTIRSARAFSYQLLVAYKTTRGEIPAAISDALQDAMEESLARVPSFSGRTVVCVDVSGSMKSPVTGEREGATSVVRCIDVAGLIGAAVLRKNPTAQVIPFHGRVVNLVLNPRDSVMTNAEKLAAVGGGATNCSAPLQLLNAKKEAVDLVIMASDNESWADRWQTRGTAMMEEWNILRQRNPKARLVCLDLQPNRTTQACDRGDVLNIGGFSDQVFDVIEEFVRGRTGMDRIAEALEAVELPQRQGVAAAA